MKFITINSNKFMNDNMFVYVDLNVNGDDYNDDHGILNFLVKYL